MFINDINNGIWSIPNGYNNYDYNPCFKHDNIQDNDFGINFVDVPLYAPTPIKKDGSFNFDEAISRKSNHQDASNAGGLDVKNFKSLCNIRSAKGFADSLTLNSNGKFQVAPRLIAKKGSMFNLGR